MFQLSGFYYKPSTVYRDLLDSSEIALKTNTTTGRPRASESPIFSTSTYFANGRTLNFKPFSIIHLLYDSKFELCWPGFGEVA